MEIIFIIIAALIGICAAFYQGVKLGYRGRFGEVTSHKVVNVYYEERDKQVFFFDLATDTYLHRSKDVASGLVEMQNSMKPKQLLVVSPCPRST